MSYEEEDTCKHTTHELAHTRTRTHA
jgi:hypothetical protein